MMEQTQRELGVKCQVRSFETEKRAQGVSHQTASLFWSVPAVELLLERAASMSFTWLCSFSTCSKASCLRPSSCCSCPLAYGHAAENMKSQESFHQLILNFFLFSFQWYVSGFSWFVHHQNFHQLFDALPNFPQAFMDSRGGTLWTLEIFFYFFSSATMRLTPAVLSEISSDAQNDASTVLQTFLSQCNSLFYSNWDHNLQNE